METFKDIATIVFGVAALVIAYKGLQTWRVQLKSTADTDLARRILIALYKIQREIAHIRRPLRETSLPEGASHFDKEAVNKAFTDQYMKEWSNLQGELVQLQVACIEAQAVWDKDFPRKLIPLNQTIAELQQHISEHIQSKNDPHHEPYLDRTETWKVLYGLGDASDTFARKVEDAIILVDMDTRPFLVK